MKLRNIRELFSILTIHAFPPNSHGRLLTSNLEVISAEAVSSGVEVLLRLPAASLPVDDSGWVQPTALCTVLDTATAVTAWMSNPQHFLAVSVGMNFSFLRKVSFEKETYVKAACVESSSLLAQTVAEVRQDDRLLATMKQTLFYTSDTVKGVFGLTDTHRAAATGSHGHSLYSQVHLISAEPLDQGVELILRLPPNAFQPHSDGFVQRTSLCTIMDAATSVSAWMSHPQQHVSLSAGMDFSFMGDIRGDREVYIKAACVEVKGQVGHTKAEAIQNAELIASLKHSVFFSGITLKDAFKLTD